MAHVAPIYPNFARGEVSPLMFGRIDVEQYPTCLDKCRNTYIRPYGCATRLTGTEFVSQTKNSGKVRLLKFVFSATDSYIIECGAGYFRFYQNGAPVIKYDRVYEISNDYYEDQLDSIQYVQLDDIIKLTCLPHNNDNTTAKPKELIRNASDSWTFRNVTFVETPYLDQNTSSITMKADATTGSTTLHASANYFTASMVGANMWLGTKVKDSATNKDVQGYVKITGYTSAQEVSVSVQAPLSGTTATKLWGEGAFSDRRGYPAVVALYDGRLYYARTPHQPRNVYGSKPYAYETFTPAVDNEDDAGINIALATNANGDGSDIKWMIGASYLLCGTYGGEFVIRGAGDGAITPTDISARQRTNWGGEPIQPIVAGTFVHFLQRNGNKLRQFQYDFYYDSYKAVDVSIFSEHLLASPIKGMALQKNPDSIIYLMREDGNVVMLTLEQDQSVQAWSLLEELGAKVESIQTIPSYDGNYDEVYMVMNRSALATSLTVTSSNPSITIQNNYTGTKAVEGEEIETVEFQASSDLIWDETVENNNIGISRCGLTYDGTQYIALYRSGFISTSTDGKIWTVAAQNQYLNQNVWDSVAYGNGLYVALAQEGIISVSSDCWATAPQTTQITSAYGIHWKTIIFDGVRFVAVGYGYDFFPKPDVYIATSYDGITWTDGTYIFSDAEFAGFTYNNLSLAYGSNKYILLGAKGYIYTSTDLNTFTKQGSLPAPASLGERAYAGIVWDGSRFFALRADGYVLTSTDGDNWQTTKAIETDIRSLKFLTFGVGHNLVAIGDLNSSPYSRYTTVGYFGHWVSSLTGEVIDFSNPDYNITYTGIPAIGDSITFDFVSEFTTPVRFIERMQNPITPDNRYDWWYVRSGLKYDGYKRTEGITLTVSANDGTVTATASGSIFTSSMVGNRIRFIDKDFNILGEGTITEYTSGTEATIETTQMFQSLTMTGGAWGISADSVSGLEHLNGREVQIYADGKEQAQKTVVEGSIEIDDAFTAVVGLPYTSYITTMPMEAGSQNGTAVGKRKRISEMAIRVWNSLGVKVGRDLDNLYETIYEQEEPFTGVIPNIKYNQGWVWDANITVEQSHPYPMNILSIAPLVTEVDK